jgi:hypothetical protein
LNMASSMKLAGLLVGLMMILLCATEAAKLRSWVGPDYFFEGDLPSNRSRHGLASTEDGKVYVFGGFGTTGDAPQQSMQRITVLQCA